jgi:hypothetical protein
VLKAMHISFRIARVRKLHSGAIHCVHLDTMTFGERNGGEKEVEAGTKE